MTIQFWSKFIFVFGILQFVARVHCKGLGDPHSTNALDRAFGNVLTTTLEKQTKATEEMFENKMADHRVELIEMFDTKQEEQCLQMDDKLDQQKDGFVQVLDDKMDHQKDEFVQLLENKFEKQKDDLVQLFQTTIEGQTKKMEENHAMVLYSLASTFIADSVQSTKSCPTNWNKVLDTCILLSSGSADFDTAIKKCEDMDGKLYEPQSLFHNQLVYALIEAKGIQSSGFWIGIHDKFTEGSFVYQSNNRSIAFQHWGSFNDVSGAQPNNKGGNQDCVEIYRTHKAWNGPKGSWNDSQCSSTYRFICEKEPQ